MSISTSKGDRIVVGTKARLRKKDEVEERSRLAFELLCNGHSKADVARIISRTVRHLNWLMARMPAREKQKIRHKVAVERRALLEDMADRLEAD
jgi:alpha-mannosidase